MKKKEIIGGIFLIFLIYLVPFIYSAGLGSPYWEDYPLYMHYGETKIIHFNLQNRIGDKDMTVKATITEGNDIASLEEQVFTIKAGTSDTMIPVKISIPKDYPKKMQTVRLDVKEIVEAGGGMIKLGSGWSTAFNVVLSEKPVEKNVFVSIIIILIIALILALSAILILIIIRKKKM